MPDKIVVYYSLEGNVEFLAKEIASKTGADLLKLETVKEYPKKGLIKFLHGGRDASFGFKPELKTEIPDLASYGTVILGTPVWASKPSAPLNTFLDKVSLKGKEVFLFTSSAGGNADKCINAVSALIANQGGTFCGAESFMNPLKNKEASEEKLNSFVQKLN